MKFSGLTKKGRAYLAKCQAASTPIQFTKMKFGDGKLIDNENPADLTDIKNIKVEKSILSKESKGDAVVLTTIIDNVSLGQGYFPRETGIYVLDEGVEVLYFYMNDGDETSWIPPEADGPHRMEVKINLISSNTGSVIVHNDGKDLYITKEYLEANYTQKGEYDGTAQNIEDRVVAAVGKEDGKFPLSEAIQGNVYYFMGNKKFYYCLKSQSNRVSVPNADFEELSIYQNRKKLENLSSSGSKKIELNIPNSSYSYAYRIGDICILNIDSGSAFVGKKANDILFKLPSNLYPKTRTIATLGSFVPRLSREIVVYIEPNGDCVLKTQDAVCQTAYYGNISYIVQN
ncbi:phage tail protein [Fusobacterium hwasookii]|uniref:phage tail-collar fiber domain-containing protein n=2 Tax=Fusobacterium hwasookii TaxID=1583098 RepID=UPI0004959EF3|nr:phage tail protein [Fusobacterium hwasookii]